MKSTFFTSAKRIGNFASRYQAPSAVNFSATALKSKSELEGEVASYYGKNANYAKLLGTNFHLGYFPHVNDASKPPLTFAESGTELTKHMMNVAGIDSTSNVIDFGCGV